MFARDAAGDPAATGSRLTACPARSVQHFAIVSRTHRAGGRAPPRTPATMSRATEELVAMGLRLVARAREQQHEVVVLQKGVGW